MHRIICNACQTPISPDREPRWVGGEPVHPNGCPHGPLEIVDVRLERDGDA